jgi:hypothetical protein
MPNNKDNGLKRYNKIRKGNAKLDKTKSVEIRRKECG